MSIISGENISSIEVEDVLSSTSCNHGCGPCVATPDEKVGRGSMFSGLQKGRRSVTEDGMKQFCREHLAGLRCQEICIHGSCKDVDRQDPEIRVAGASAFSDSF